MANPEQQGLKHYWLRRLVGRHEALMANPEQQGLKLAEGRAVFGNITGP